MKLNWKTKVQAAKTLVSYRIYQKENKIQKFKNGFVEGLFVVIKSKMEEVV